ncbi:hypothetical protein [Nocardia sp. NPDC055049]
MGVDDDRELQSDVPVNLSLAEDLLLAGRGVVIGAVAADEAGDLPELDDIPEFGKLPDRVVLIQCEARVTYDQSRIKSIDVRGVNANEVRDVTRSLVDDLEVHRREQDALRSPWFSGLFYLAVLCVVIVLLLAAGRVLPIWSLPVVVAAAAILVSVVGALQMRQDDRLSERGFLALMGDVFRSLPTLLSRSETKADDPSTECRDR